MGHIADTTQTYLAETFSNLADERALILGIAQTMGATFTAWLPLLIFNTGTQAPLFHQGYVTISIVSGCQALGVLAMWYLGSKISRESKKAREAREAADQQSDLSPVEEHKGGFASNG